MLQISKYEYQGRDTDLNEFISSKQVSGNWLGKQTCKIWSIIFKNIKIVFFSNLNQNIQLVTK